MPILDSTAKVALSGSVFSPAYFIRVDIDSPPMRFTTFGADQVISGSGDSELDGTYVAWAGQLLQVGDISFSENGSDTLTLALSGIVTIDTDLLNDIGDRSKWQGKLFRIWCRLYDELGVTPQGAIFPLYTGYMSSVKIVAAPEEQLIQVSIENWRAAFSQASNRTYLDQKDYDATDTSAQATIAAANGMRRDTGGAKDGGTIPGGTNPNVTPGFGWTGSGGYVAYTPYPDNQSVSYDNPSFTGTQKA